MARLRVGVVGASGYAGSVAARLIASHPHAVLAFATSDRLAGRSVGAELGMRVIPELVFVSNGAAVDQSDGCDAVLLATSAEVSMRLAPELAERGKQVIDLSGAFRLDAKEYPRWYRFDHTAPHWVERAHYGLPELFGSPPKGSIVANPGCYPTAALLALAPLLREGLVAPEGIIIDGKSGVTGAGKQTGEAYSFAELDADVRAYKVLAHQHGPEIDRALGKVGRRAAVSVTFAAHLLPIKRGLITTCYGRPLVGATAERVAQCLADTYSKAAFVHAMPLETVMIKRVAGTNDGHVGATAGPDVVVSIGAIDNLVKGAAGQAVQNLNLMNGWEETTGLDTLQRFSP